MKVFKRIVSFLLVLVMVSGITVYADTNIVISEPTIQVSEEDSREFTITYDLSVTYEQEITDVDVVLVLDRSNSMLDVDDSGQPVVETVWNAANTFVNNFYEKYPDGDLAVVSFGTNANKKDNWKYCTGKQDALDEISDIYSYRTLYTDGGGGKGNQNKNKNGKGNGNSWNENDYTNHGLDLYYYILWLLSWPDALNYWSSDLNYAWNNWQYHDGSTNIKEGFEYAKRTIEKKNKHSDFNNDAIVLFSDGVATRGGWGENDYNSPHEHNSNTLAAINAGKEAGEIANVITVGYFEGINDNQVAEIARDTLNQAQNGGFFEATDIDEVINIFEDVVDELDYVGTETIFTDTINKEFSLLEDTIMPTAESITTDNIGNTTITWNIGSLNTKDYTISYTVRTKDTAYVAGEDGVAINNSGRIEYLDLDGNPVTKSFQPAIVDVPSLDEIELPIIEYTLNNYDFTESVDVSININSEHTKIVEFMLLQGNKTEEDFDDIDDRAGYGLDIINSSDYEVSANINASIAKIGDEPYYYEGNGLYTVYVKDELGNVIIKKIFINNLFDKENFDFEDLPDNT